MPNTFTNIQEIALQWRRSRLSASLNPSTASTLKRSEPSIWRARRRSVAACWSKTRLQEGLRHPHEIIMPRICNLIQWIAPLLISVTNFDFVKAFEFECVKFSYGFTWEKHAKQLLAIQYAASYIWDCDKEYIISRLYTLKEQVFKLMIHIHHGLNQQAQCLDL